jgi:cysteine desulfurase
VALESGEGASGLHAARIGGLRDQLEAAVRAIPGARVVGSGAARVENTLSVTFDGCPGQLLLVALDLAGVAASSGAACSSGTPGPSPVLAAMGLSPEACRGAIRFSLWRGNTGAEIDRVCELLPALVARVRGG